MGEPVAEVVDLLEEMRSTPRSTRLQCASCSALNERGYRVSELGDG